LPGNRFYGTVTQIAPLPDAQSMWMNPDLKVYNSEIYIDQESEILRTGMGCQAEIIAQQYRDVIYIPIQAVTRIGSQPTVYVQVGGSIESREVEIGLDNNKMIHIKEGLNEGDIILLNPPLKSTAVDSENKLSEQTPSEDLQQKISENLNNTKTKESDQQQPAESTPAFGQPPANMEEAKRRFESLTPEQREEMRKRFEQMSPEEKEKLRTQWQKRVQQ
jgi:HlyD family secretion protein